MLGRKRTQSYRTAYFQSKMVGLLMYQCGKTSFASNELTRIFKELYEVEYNLTVAIFTFDKEPKKRDTKLWLDSFKASLQDLRALTSDLAVRAGRAAVENKLTMDADLENKVREACEAVAAEMKAQTELKTAADDDLAENNRFESDNAVQLIGTPDEEAEVLASAIDANEEGKDKVANCSVAATMKTETESEDVAEADKDESKSSKARSVADSPRIETQEEETQVLVSATHSDEDSRDRDINDSVAAASAEFGGAAKVNIQDQANHSSSHMESSTTGSCNIEFESDGRLSSSPSHELHENQQRSRKANNLPVVTNVDEDDEILQPHIKVDGVRFKPAIVISAVVALAFAYYLATYNRRVS